MADRSYTASERRGIIAIALLALLITGGGIAVSLWSHGDAASQEPVINILPQPIDSMLIEEKDSSKIKSENSSESKKASSKTSRDKKSPKTYRRRNPLDEPV